MLANPVRGEITIEIEGQTYVLVFDFNVLCVLEDRLDLGVREIVAKMSGDMRGGFLRTLLWGALQTHQPDITELEAGRLIGLVGLQPAIDKLMQAVALAFPKPEADATVPGPRKPAKSRKTGTSKPSSPPGAS